MAEEGSLSETNCTAQEIGHGSSKEKNAFSPQ
jgi:hypothetical protein